MSSGLDMSRSMELQKVLHSYRDLVDVEGKLVLDAYNLRKPLTEIEIYGRPIRRVREFVAWMREFFFVEMLEYPSLPYEPGRFYGRVYVSRFKTLPAVAVQYDGLSDTYSDLAGVLYGYSLENIVDYCRRLTPEQFKWDDKDQDCEKRMMKATSLTLPEKSQSRHSELHSRSKLHLHHDEGRTPAKNKEVLIPPANRAINCHNQEEVCTKAQIPRAD